MKAYRLKRGRGRTYDVGIDITVKAGELGTTNGAAVVEFITRKGEEPEPHVHKTEDEMFYVVEGKIDFTCEGKRFEAATGDFVFLPRGKRHGYTIRSRKPVRLLVVTAPPRRAERGWGGFVSDFEKG